MKRRSDCRMHGVARIVRTATGRALFRLFGILCLAPLLILCNDIERPSPWTLLLGGVGRRIGVVSSDYGAAGRFTTLDPNGLVFPGSVPIHSDAVARFRNGRVVIINRLNRDSIEVINPELALLTELEYSTGAGTNPHDYAVHAGRAYISRYNHTDLLVVDERSGVVLNSIGLGGFAETTPVPDGLPEMSGLHIEGGALFVALQRLDRNDPSGHYPPAGQSLLLEIDLALNQVVAEYPLPLTNPFGRLRRVFFEGQPHLVIAAPGRLGALSELDGGVVAFNLQNRTFSSPPLYLESVAGGDILEAVIRDDHQGYALILDAALNKFLHRFDPSTGIRQSIVASFPQAAGSITGLLLTDEGRLYVGNGDFSHPGVMIFDTNNNDALLTPVPISVGLRPVDLIEIE